MLGNYTIQLLCGTRQCLQVPVVCLPDSESQTEPDRQTNIQSKVFGGIETSIIYLCVSIQLLLLWSLLSLICLIIAIVINLNVTCKFECFLFLSIFSFQLQMRQVTKMHDHFHDLPVSSLFYFSWLISISAVEINPFNKSFNLILCPPCCYSSFTVVNWGTIVLSWKSHFLQKFSLIEQSWCKFKRMEGFVALLLFPAQKVITIT